MEFLRLNFSDSILSRTQVDQYGLGIGIMRDQFLDENMILQFSTS
jgi:hypothetical protein